MPLRGGMLVQIEALAVARDATSTTLSNPFKTRQIVETIAAKRFGEPQEVADKGRIMDCDDRISRYIWNCWRGDAGARKV